MPKIVIDEKEYDTEGMSKEALAQVQSLQYVTNELTRLQLQVAAMQTARQAYAVALKSILENGDNSVGDDSEIELPDSISFD